MSQKDKLLAKILSGSKNIQFDEFVILVEAFGFHLARINGSHHIFQHPTIAEQLNLQNKNGQAKSYQIKQFLRFVEEYNLTMGNEPPQK
jgi:predicted RNA binding protein YcfA (HicA-like mRNA interferase family)